MTRVTWAEWWRSAFSLRMLAMLLVVLAGAGLFIRLGAWQLDRAAIRGAAEAKAITAERLEADPVPLETVLAVGDTFTTSHQLRKVEVSGEWGETVVIRERAVNDEPALLVVGELRLESGAWIPVLRGWVPTSFLPDDAASNPSLIPAAVEELVPAPSGPAQVTGYLSASEDSLAPDHDSGVADSISTAALANQWEGPTFGGFVVAADGEHFGLRTMPPPSYSQQEGMNLQNLFYAAEWFIFGGFALVLWWRLVRDDAMRAKERAILAEASA